MSQGNVAECRAVSDLFDDALKIFTSITKSNEATNSSSIQSQVKTSMGMLEEATRLVSLAGMFSTNESVEEMPTSDMKFLLLPALLGTLSLKLCSDDRMEIIRTAEVYFRDFLQRCKLYGIVDIEIPEPESKSPEDSENTAEVKPKSCEPELLTMARERNAKLKRYKEFKELESQLEDLRKDMAVLNVDDEIQRKYYLTMIKSYANQAVDELNSIELEKPLIEHMNKVKKGLPMLETGCKEVRNRGYQPRKPLLPVIITKDEVQKRVFGAGYPSRPTMTVDEFYEKKVRDGEFASIGAVKTRTLHELALTGQKDEAKEMEAIEKEKNIEEDNPETLRQARDWDEFKDEHRRGCGNRMNRS